MTEEEIRERDAKCGFGKDHNKVIMGWQAEKDRRWLLRELDRMKKDLEICRKSKSVYDYSDKMSERVNAEVNHLLKEKVKRLEQQLAEARKDTERLDFAERWIEGWRSKPENYLKCISIAVDKDLMPTIRQAIDNARGKE